MLTNEIRRLIRNLVEATEECQIDKEEVKEALSEAFEFCSEEIAHVRNTLIDFREQNNDISQKIRQFVAEELTPMTCRNIPVLLEKEEFDFVVTALLVYYKLSEEQVVVDINDWLNMISIETKLAPKKVYPLVHTKLKPCLGTYMKVAWQSKRINKIMAQFYQEYMKLW